MSEERSAGKKFSYEVVASILHDRASVDAIFSRYEGFFRNHGGSRVSDGSVGTDEVPVFFILTGGTEGIVIERLEKRAASGTRPLPAVIVAHNRHNSLPAALEIVARLRQDGGRAILVFMQGTADSDRDVASGEQAAGDQTAGDALDRAVHLVSVMAAMRSARIGAVGQPSDWLVASSQEGEAIASTWGLTLVPVPVAELRAKMKAHLARPGEPDALSDSFREGANFCREPDAGDMAASLAIYRGLSEIVGENKLSALTLRCFDLVVDDKATGCFALSRLADEGIDAGCEGDVAAIVALRWMRLLTGQAAWMANPSDVSIDRADGTGRLLLAHCTVPRTMVDSYGIRSHFESGLGVAVAGAFPKGPVTLVRLGGKSLDKAWIAEGMLTDSPSMDGLCRTQAWITLDSSDIGTMLEAPLGNHIVMVRGHHGSGARKYLELAGFGTWLMPHTKKS